MAPLTPVGAPSPRLSCLRYVHAAHPLQPYCRSEAMGRWLLTELEHASRARHARRDAAGLAGLAQRAEQAPRYGAFVLCMPLADRDCFLVVTTKVRRGRAGGPLRALVPSALLLCFARHPSLTAHPRTLALQRLLYIHAREPMWGPEVRWSCAVADLELAAARGAHLRCAGRWQ